MNKCPCGSQIDYQACCGLYINNQATAKTPEALMRSRFTAYTQANIDYIKKTMRGRPLLDFNDIDALNWAKRVNWLSLKIIKAYSSESNPNKGFVEFIARYKERDGVEKIHELSEFQRYDDTWFYTAGHQPERQQSKQKISRNDACPCGSQKKFKNCCLRKSKI